MSILSCLQDVTAQLGLPQPSAVVSSTDATIKQLLALAYEVGEDLRSQVMWSELNKEGSITLVASQESYALPADFDRMNIDTFWDTNSDDVVLGPIGPADWMAEKYGITSSGINWTYRVRGYTGSNLFLTPTPASGDAGTVLKFEYQTTSWILPVAWSNGVTFATGAYCSHDGSVYSATVGGVTNGTSPSDDVGVTWAAYTTPYNTFLADTDCPQLDNYLLKLGIKYLYLETKGQPWQFWAQRYNDEIRRKRGQKLGARVLSLVPTNDGPKKLDSDNLPETGYS